MDNRRIGVFDSGLGGLTAVKALQQQLPEERVLYFGDTARTPYGSKHVSTIKEFSNQICDFLVDNDVKMIVIACNTVSATCKDMLQERFPQIPVVDIISPMVEKLSAEYKRNSIGIIGTKVTIESKEYPKQLEQLDKGIKVNSLACPIFVPLIEEGITDRKILNPSIKYYLDKFLWDNQIDTLVLGCTHYPLIEKNISKLYPRVNILNPSEVIIGRVEKILRDKDMLANGSALDNIFYASDLSESFTRMIETIKGNGSTAFKQLGSPV